MVYQKPPKSCRRLATTIPSSPSSGSDVTQENLTNFYMAAGNLLRCLEPTKDDVAKRIMLINDLKTFIKSFSQFKGCTLEAYGSYASQLYTRYSDIDLCIRHGDKFSLYKLQAYMKLESDDYSNIEVKKGPVEVLTFKHQNSEISFDITVHTNDTKSGKRSASLMSLIKEIDGRFRQLVLLVKGWAMCHSINDASNGGFKSYALCTLVILFLQTIKPPVLPPLSELCSRELIQKMIDNDERWQIVFKRNVARYKESRGCEENKLDVYTLFHLFIQKFKHIRETSQDYYVSARSGDWVAKTDKMLKKEDQLWIEEPLCGCENLGRTIKNVRRIGTVFKATHKVIKAGNMDAILEHLVPKHLLKEIKEMQSVTSSENIVPSSPEVPAERTDMDDANGISSSSLPGKVKRLVNYSSDSDDDEDEDVLELDCSASDEGLSSEMKYGLNLRGPSQQKKQPARPPLPSVLGFGDDDEDDVERYISQQANKKALKKVEELHKKALEEDQSAFAYDDVYDEMLEKKALQVGLITITSSRSVD